MFWQLNGGDTADVFQVWQRRISQYFFIYSRCQLSTLKSRLESFSWNGLPVLSHLCDVQCNHFSPFPTPLFIWTEFIERTYLPMLCFTQFDTGSPRDAPYIVTVHWFRLLKGSTGAAIRSFTWGRDLVLMVLDGNIREYMFFCNFWNRQSDSICNWQGVQQWRSGFTLDRFFVGRLSESVCQFISIWMIIASRPFL